MPGFGGGRPGYYGCGSGNRGMYSRGKRGKRTGGVSDRSSCHASARSHLDSREDVGSALFAGKGTSRISKNGIEALLRRLGKTAGVENVHPHRVPEDVVIKSSGPRA